MCDWQSEWVSEMQLYILGLELLGSKLPKTLVHEGLMYYLDVLNTHWITNIFLTAIMDELIVLIELIQLIELISLIHSHIPNCQL